MREAVTKCMNGRTHIAGDFLVVEEPQDPQTWHLPVKVQGKPDHRLMGAAWAALNNPNGFRGNKYEGPRKAEAQRKQAFFAGTLKKAGFGRYCAHRMGHQKSDFVGHPRKSSHWF